MNFQQGYRPPQPPPPPKPPKKKWPYLMLALLIVAAIGAGVYGYRYIQDVKAEQARIKALSDAVSQYDDTYLPGIYVDGISLGGMTAQEGIDAVLAQIKERQTEIGFADRIFAVDDGLPDQVVGDTLGIELIVADIRKIKRDCILEVLKAADLK